MLPPPPPPFSPPPVPFSPSLLSTLRQRKWHVSGDADDTTNTARLSEAFVDLDRDGDGVLSISEFAPLAKAVGADGADAVQEIFNQLDTHGNGVISESEFLAFSRQTLECDDLDGLGDDRGTRTR